MRLLEEQAGRVQALRRPPEPHPGGGGADAAEQRAVKRHGLATTEQPRATAPQGTVQVVWLLERQEARLHALARQVGDRTPTNNLPLAQPTSAYMSNNALPRSAVRPNRLQVARAIAGAHASSNLEYDMAMLDPPAPSPGLLRDPGYHGGHRSFSGRVDSMLWIEGGMPF